jgi:hypothetical protein
MCCLGYRRHAMCLTTVGLTGDSKREMHFLGAPANETALIQQIDILAGHAICAIVERHLFGSLQPPPGLSLNVRMVVYKGAAGRRSPSIPRLSGERSTFHPDCNTRGRTTVDRT